MTDAILIFIVLGFGAAGFAGLIGWRDSRDRLFLVVAGVGFAVALVAGAFLIGG